MAGIEKMRFEMQPLTRNEIIGLVFRLTLFGAITYCGIRWIVNTLDPTRKQKLEAQKQVRTFQIDVCRITCM